MNFKTIHCPIRRCDATVLERSGDGTFVKKRCRCGRMLLVTDVGNVIVLEEVEEEQTVEVHNVGSVSSGYRELAQAKG